MTITATSGTQQSNAEIVLYLDDAPPTGFFVTNLGTLGGTQSEARAVNASGQVVGSAFNANQIRHAILYQNAQMQDLGTLGAAQSYAYDINNAGKVVGAVELSLFGENYRAFYYDTTTMRNLNSLIPQSSGWTLLEARGINNIGQIVGRDLIN